MDASQCRYETCTWNGGVPTTPRPGYVPAAKSEDRQIRVGDLYPGRPDRAYPSGPEYRRILYLGCVRDYSPEGGCQPLYPAGRSCRSPTLVRP
jgi:hypothetical protein